MPTEPGTHQKLLEAMLALGCCEIHGASKAWRVFSHDSIPGKRFFLGVAGALRAGESVNNSSAAYTEKARLIKTWEEFHLQEPTTRQEAS